MKEGETPFKTDCYEVGDLTVNINNRTVYRNKEHLLLPELSFDLFVRLIQEAPKPVNRDTLISEVWRSNFINDDTIVQRVALLRKALNDDPKTPRYIRTVRGEGYALLANVKAKITDDAVHQNSGEFNANNKLVQFKKVQYLSVAALILITIIVSRWPYNLNTKTEPEVNRVVQSNDDKLNEQARQLLSVWQAEETDKAIKLLESLLLSNPNHIEATITLSFALSTRETKFNGLNEDALRAETLARTALEYKPESGKAWHALAYALDAQSRIDEALLAYHRAYEIDPEDTTAMSSAAHLMFVRGRLYESLQLDLKGLKSPDSSIFAELQIAKSLELLGIASSEHWWYEAERLPLNDVKFRTERIKSYLVQNQLVKAEKLLTDTLANYPNSENFHYLLGKLMLQKNNTGKARQYFIQSGNQGVNDLALLEALNGNITQAQKQIKKLQQQVFHGDTWPAVRIALAEHYAAIDEKNESIEMLADAVDLGWRDIKTIETSIFLKEILPASEWKELKNRIQQEIDAQRVLVIGVPELLLLHQPK